MSRDSRLIRTRLLELREHLAGHHEYIRQTGELVHAELQAKRDTRPAVEHRPVELHLPEPHDAPVDH